MKLVRLLDWILIKGITIVCGILLAVMVVFTIYTVIMRTVFLNPPFWGDTLTLFANIWLVMLAFAMAVRSQSNIAIESVYVLLPGRIADGLRLFWQALFAVVGLIMTVYGYQAASRILGAFWELGNLPKSYPMMILPIAGVLIFLSAVLTIAEHFGAGGREGRGDASNHKD